MTRPPHTDTELVELARDGSSPAFGSLLHRHRVTLQRAGVERVVHNFAFIYPMSYGLIAVLIAVLSGLLASAYFRRQPG